MRVVNSMLFIVCCIMYAACCSLCWVCAILYVLRVTVYASCVASVIHVTCVARSMLYDVCRVYVVVCVM